MGQQPGDIMSLVGYHVLGRMSYPWSNVMSLVRMSCPWFDIMSLVGCHVLGQMSCLGSDVMSCVRCRVISLRQRFCFQVIFYCSRGN